MKVYVLEIYRTWEGNFGDIEGSFVFEGVFASKDDAIATLPRHSIDVDSPYAANEYHITECYLPSEQLNIEAIKIVETKAVEYEEEARDVRNSTDDKHLCKAISTSLRGAANQIKQLVDKEI